MAIGLLLASTLSFALMDGLTKILSHTLPIPQILWVRSLVFSALMLGLLTARGLPLRALIHSHRPWLQLARALLLVVEGGMFMLAFTLMPLADVHAIAALSPLAVVALSVPLLGEKVGWRRWMAVLAGFAGVLLIVRPGFAKVEPAALIALFAATLWAFYQIMVRMCARTDSSDTTSLWTAVVGMLATSLVGPAAWLWPSGSEWALLAAIALLGSIAHMALIHALSLTQPSVLQPYSYTMFVWAVVVGYLLFGAVPNAWTWAGATIIIASGIYAWNRERISQAGAVRAAAAGPTPIAAE